VRWLEPLCQERALKRVLGNMQSCLKAQY